MEEHENVQLTKVIQVMLDKQTEIFNARMDASDKKIEPVIRIYQATTGFTSVLNALFKSVVIPLSVLIGIFLTVKEFFGGVHAVK